MCRSGEGFNFSLGVICAFFVLVAAIVVLSSKFNSNNSMLGLGTNCLFLVNKFDFILSIATVFLLVFL